MVFDNTVKVKPDKEHFATHCAKLPRVTEQSSKILGRGQKSNLNESEDDYIIQLHKISTSADSPYHGIGNKTKKME